MIKEIWAFHEGQNGKWINLGHGSTAQEIGESIPDWHILEPMDRPDFVFLIAYLYRTKKAAITLGDVKEAVSEIKQIKENILSCIYEGWL